VNQEFCGEEGSSSDPSEDACLERKAGCERLRGFCSIEKRGDQPHVNSIRGTEYPVGSLRVSLLTFSSKPYLISNDQGGKFSVQADLRYS